MGKYKKQFTVTDCGNGVWEINESTDEIKNYVDAYLVCGTKRAALIDSLMSEGNLVEILHSLTSLPIDVILTHGHGDHAGQELKNLVEAGMDIYLDARDIGILKGMFKSDLDESIFKPLNDGQVFDLGDRKLEVISVPGHTPGSIVVIDRENQLMFSGDTLGAGIIWMQLPHSAPLDKYLVALRRLEKEVKELNDLRIYPGHLYQATDLLGQHYITEMRELTEGLVSGKIIGVPIEDKGTVDRFPGLQASHGLMYRYCYNPENIHTK